MFIVEFVMDSGSYEYPLPAVPREGDTVKLWGESRKVAKVEWDPQSYVASRTPFVTVYLGERR